MRFTLQQGVKSVKVKTACWYTHLRTLLWCHQQKHIKGEERKKGEALKDGQEALKVYSPSLPLPRLRDSWCLSACLSDSKMTSRLQVSHNRGGNELFDRGLSSTGAFYLARLKNVIERIRIRSESIHQSSCYWSETEPNLN